MTTRPESVDPDAVSAPNRRRWLMAGSAALAALGGWGAYRWSETHPSPNALAVQDLWNSSFETLDGKVLAMQTLKGRPLLLNFWATWCPPCVAELPMLDAFYAQQAARGWQVLGLAVDQREAVIRFQQRAPVRFPLVMAGMQGLALSKSLGNVAGGLPFTLVLGKEGKVQNRKIGELTEQDLANWSV